MKTILKKNTDINTFLAPPSRSILNYNFFDGAGLWSDRYIEMSFNTFFAAL